MRPKRCKSGPKAEDATPKLAMKARCRMIRHYASCGGNTWGSEERMIWRLRKPARRCSLSDPR
eukprot:254880-Chlamydomonas_euryale.AAC.1